MFLKVYHDGSLPSVDVLNLFKQLSNEEVNLITHDLTSSVVEKRVPHVGDVVFILTCEADGAVSPSVSKLTRSLRATEEVWLRLTPHSDAPKSDFYLRGLLPASPVAAPPARGAGAARPSRAVQVREQRPHGEGRGEGLAAALTFFER